MPLIQPALNATPFAKNGLRNTIPTNADPDAEAAASMELGFPELTMKKITLGGIPPSGRDMNGILNFLSQHQVWLNGGGQYKFNVELANAVGGYAKGAVLASNDGLRLYVSTIDGNTTDFNSDMTGWKMIGTSELQTLLDALQTNINNETQWRENADTSLFHQIQQEATWRTNADLALQQNIDNEIASRVSSDEIINSKIDTKYDKAGGLINGEVTITNQLNLRSSLWLYSPYDNSSFVIGYENQDSKDIAFLSNPINVAKGKFKFNQLAKFTQGIVTTSLDVSSYGVDDNTSLKVTTQGSYTNFRMTDSTGNPDTNPLFVFEGRLQSDSSFLATPAISAGDMTSQRSLSTIYVNNSPRPLVINVTSNLTNGGTYIQGFFSEFAGAFRMIAKGQINSNVSDGGCNITFIVPSGYYYKVEGSGHSFWSECY